MPKKTRLKTHWFTFGWGHAHAIDGFTYDKDIVLEITSENPREIMMNMFGNKWSNEYNSCPDMSLFPRGIKKVEA
jgi:hypothetical protein